MDDNTNTNSSAGSNIDLNMDPNLITPAGPVAPVTPMTTPTPAAPPADLNTPVTDTGADSLPSLSPSPSVDSPTKGQNAMEPKAPPSDQNPLVQPDPVLPPNPTKIPKKK